MRKTLFSVAVMTALGVCGSASAQNMTNTMDFNMNGFTVRGGVGLVIDNNLSDFANTLINVGVDYTIPNTLIPGAETFLSIDYFFKGLGGEKGSIIPIAINGRWHDKGAFGTRNYVYGGIGLTVLDIVSTSTKFGLRGGFGKELSEAIVFELGVTYSEADASNAKNTQFTLNLGYRF